MSKELKQEYIKKECEKERNPEKWAKFLNANYSDVIEIDGKFFPIEKEQIKKIFCFGVGLNARATQEEIEHGIDMEQKAQNDINYFVSENLKGINQKINKLKYFLIDEWEEKQKYIDTNKMRYHLHFEKCYLANKSICNDASVTFLMLDDDKLPCYKSVKREATKSEIQKVIDALENEKEQFKKRLQTYLKRYGLSKVRTWSYIVD